VLNPVNLGKLASILSLGHFVLVLPLDPTPRAGYHPDPDVRRVKAA